MNRVRKAVSILSFLVLVEYVLGGFVTFDDPTDAGFGLGSFVTSGPGALPLIHRAFAVVMIVAWIIGLHYLRGTGAYRMARVAVALMVIQSVIGALIPATLQQPSLNPFVIIAHFAFSGLIFIAAGFTFYFGWTWSGEPQADDTGRTPQGSN